MAKKRDGGKRDTADCLEKLNGLKAAVKPVLQAYAKLRADLDRFDILMLELDEAGYKATIPKYHRKKRR